MIRVNLKWNFLLLASGFALWSQSCAAHNSGVVVQGNEGKLVTGFIDESSLVHTIEQRAFPVLLPGSLADDFPGFLSQGSPAGGNDPLTVGGDLYFDFLPMHNDGIATNLFYWDGVGTTVQDVEFGLAQDASLSLYTENLSDFSTATGTDELVDGTHVGTVSTSSTTPLHAHLWSFLGSTSTVPEGIYLISMRLTMEDYENSDALYVVAATNNISASTLYDLAMPWVEDHLDTLVLPGDFDFDGEVNGDDFLTWQRDPSVGNLADWQASYGSPTVAATSVVPEPTTLMLAWMVGTLAVTCRRGC